MKTLQQVTAMCENARSRATQATFDGNDKDLKAAKKRILLYNDVIAYLETEPREEYLDKAKDRIISRIEGLREDAEGFVKEDAPNRVKLIRKYLKDNGVPQLNKQLAVINLILK